jgi:hypothetical protein
VSPAGAPATQHVKTADDPPPPETGVGRTPHVSCGLVADNQLGRGASEGSSCEFIACPTDGAAKANMANAPTPSVSTVRALVLRCVIWHGMIALARTTCKVDRLSVGLSAKSPVCESTRCFTQRNRPFPALAEADVKPLSVAVIRASEAVPLSPSRGSEQVEIAVAPSSEADRQWRRLSRVRRLFCGRSPVRCRTIEVTC